ncbi:glucans biosynthesis glucosyltransferase MdoH [Litchfieldella xinjiangensis]|uniref:glucans biosynthesis glucosyltransferase MdoH n=1 Tax=Litchfieldella xinjiangensis TaxID=1166948 RepID=UPI0018CE6280|nr:glucans biosynthesis glucosyltransferase MdoH [Halomonas xinjiangensis]
MRSAKPSHMPLLGMRRLVFALLVLSSTAAGGWAMFEILRVNGITTLQSIVLGLFVITFGWITIAFWTAIAGFVLLLIRRDPATLVRFDPDAPAQHPGEHRTVLVMPIYNEDPERVVDGLESTCRSVLEQPGGDGFEVFVISDTRDDTIADEEATAIAALQRRLAPDMQVYYRRRESNEGRKAGNLSDFCRQWGNRYDYMVVLDADSVMGGKTLVTLVASMQANPQVGLIQTIPIPVRSESVFGRFTQFAAALHSPLLATGQSFWQGDTANFWGHNAIIRTQAFMASCGLPNLPGNPPLGGEILSHDFVEAALLRRAGWETHLEVRVDESYEEVPSNILEFAKRDRRWTQGNMQHLRLLTGKGLHGMSRFHFLFGALAFMTSLLWALMLIVSTVDAIGRAQGRHTFFSDGYQLFPDWPIATPDLIMPLIASTAAVLLLPKILGSTLAFIQRPEAFGGRGCLIASTVFEIVIAILIAPIMMVYHSFFILSILSGGKVSWDAQVREGRSVPWWDAIRHTWAATLLGAVWAIATYQLAPVFFWWLSPVWFGLLLSAPLVKMTSSLTHGNRLRRLGLLLVPSEVQPTRVLRTLGTFAEEVSLEQETAQLQPPPPPVPGEMPIQSFSQQPPPQPTAQARPLGPATPDTEAHEPQPDPATQTTASRKNTAYVKD